MPLVVGVTFRRVGKVYYFDPEELTLHEGDFVIAETARGVEFGEVALEPREVSDDQLVAPLKKVIRIANGEDLDREATNREREKHAYEVCERKIAQHELPMKLLDAEYSFDGSQVTFSFSADGRVDFRELVKDVASSLKSKVQLHQIGVRDEAKLIGGYGTCGRALCCASFLSNFEPISMKMAKDQSLFLNPAKFSGVCGKLMCCLRYEHDFYKLAHKRLPSVGAIVPYEQGRAKVIDVNVISGMITVQTEADVQIHIHASKLPLQGLCRRHGIACNMSESHCQALLANDEYTDESAEAEDEDLVDEDISPELLDDDVDSAHILASPGSPREELSGVKFRTPADKQPGKTENADAPRDGSETVPKKNGRSNHRSRRRNDRG